MTSVLCPYVSFWHWRPEDEDYLRRLDPAWARVHQPTARAIEVVQRNAPNANIMLRSWDIDDHNGDRKRELYADPKGAARKHLEMWRAKWDELITEMHRNHWSADESRWYIGLVNEPDPAYVPQVVEYTREAMQIVKGTSIRLGVVCSSVGTFMKPSEGDRGWTQFMPLEKPINDGRHILIVHSYWQPEGPRFGEDAGNLAWRHRHIPLDVPILIGEAGANGFIYNRHSKNDDAGWQKFMQPDQYAAQVKDYIEGCDTRVRGVCLYMLDFHSDQWWSFDTRPAMEQLLAIKDAKPLTPNPFAASAPQPVTVHLPTVGTGPQPTPAIAYVNAPAGLYLRAAPINGAILIAIPFAEQIRITGVGQDGWVKVRYGQHEGWAAAQYISLEAPAPLPQPAEPTPQPVEPTPPATGDNWARSIAFVLKEEGGLSVDRNDPGNYVNGVFIGTNFGISANAHPDVDIVNLTVEQAKNIYRQSYWGPSGASTLPFPLCLAVMDLAVNGGVGTAQRALKEAGHDFVRYMAWRIDWYTRIKNFDRYGVAWIRRCSRLMMEATK